MTIWLSELLSPAGLLRHVALFLVVVAAAMPAIRLARWALLAAGVVGGVVTSGLAYDPPAFFWWSLLVIVALVRIVTASDWRFGGKLSGDAARFHQEIVPDLGPGQVRKLLAAGAWREVVPGTVLTRAGERISEFCFIARGQVDIVVDGRKVADCGPGSLIGEIGLSTGDPATATAVCATPVRYLGFDTNRLYRLLDNHSGLQDAIELAIERSLREKIHRANMAAAHPSR